MPLAVRSSIAGGRWQNSHLQYLKVTILFPSSSAIPHPLPASETAILTLLSQPGNAAEATRCNTLSEAVGMLALAQAYHRQDRKDRVRMAIEAFLLLVSEYFFRSALRRVSLQYSFGDKAASVIADFVGTGLVVSILRDRHGHVGEAVAVLMAMKAWNLRLKNLPATTKRRPPKMPEYLATVIRGRVWLLRAHTMDGYVARAQNDWLQDGDEFKVEVLHRWNVFNHEERVHLVSTLVTLEQNGHVDGLVDGLERLELA
ncbi:hypothetical protein EJ06DRAFT_525087 [Trichodelitschia bisporula]|uniref:Uncharacterized protein n=1 Tax=Trichodelitschia bisporula TaxID=703511 RepID=A0A6G1HIW5_9PEZI|nr:hypothetical protein EJ06DRAFT_525087 [Trichodelitschia bisporula]